MWVKPWTLNPVLFPIVLWNPLPEENQWKSPVFYNPWSSFQYSKSFIHREIYINRFKHNTSIVYIVLMQFIHFYHFYLFFRIFSSILWVCNFMHRTRFHHCRLCRGRNLVRGVPEIKNKQHIFKKECWDRMPWQPLSLINASW